MQEYQNDSLKDYFAQDGLLVPIETIRGKSQQRSIVETVFDIDLFAVRRQERDEGLRVLPAAGKLHESRRYNGEVLAACRQHKV